MIESLADVRCALAGAWLPGENDPVLPLGSGYSHSHQLEMFNAVSSGSAEAVLNTNPTGGGKTLSWAAPVIRSCEGEKPLVALATYPTRALIADQKSLLTDYFRTYFSNDQWAHPWQLEHAEQGRELLVHDETGAEHPVEERVTTVTGSSLENSDTTAAGFREAERVISNASADGLPTIVLTTPDALTLLASNRYADSDLGAFPSLVDRIVVDEFHLSSPRGKRLLPFHLDTYLTLGQTPLSQLIFLSATPTTTYANRIDRAFETTRVERTVHPTPPDTGRQILPAVEFGVTNCRLFGAGEWLADRVGQIESFVSPPGQTLIIVDSVREVEMLAEKLSTNTVYDVGRIYGWKKQGRASSIRESDIIVGNTAVEVGVDFDRVNRMVFTAHDPNSALQRLGRMRSSSEFDDYRALCLSTPNLQDKIHTELQDDPDQLTRTTLEKIFASELSTRGASLPYDAICAAYTRYLWSDADDPLNHEYVPARARDPYRRLVYDHFGPELEQLHEASLGVEDLWEILGNSQYLQKERVLDELHTYRSSTLGCLAIDKTDPEEPLKEYSLTHVLRYRHGRIFSADQAPEVFETEIGRSLEADERAFIRAVQDRVECGFVVTGRVEKPRDLSVRRRHWRPTSPALNTLSKLRLSIDPPIHGQEELDPISSDVLVHFVPESPSQARDVYDAGPYANVLPYHDGSVFLWQDAILTHSADVAARIN